MLAESDASTVAVSPFNPPGHLEELASFAGLQHRIPGAAIDESVVEMIVRTSQINLTARKRCSVRLNRRSESKTKVVLISRLFD